MTTDSERWQAVDAYTADHLDTFGGAYHDGRQIVTLWTADLERHTRTLQALAGPGVVTRAARWPASDLESIQARIDADMDSLVAEDIKICVLTVDLAANCVEVGVTELTDAAEQALRARYGPGVQVKQAEIRHPLP